MRVSSWIVGSSAVLILIMGGGCKATTVGTGGTTGSGTSTKAATGTSRSTTTMGV